MTSELLELNRGLKQKRRELMFFLNAAKNAETGKYDLSALDLAEYNRREDELTELSGQYDLKRAEYQNIQQLGLLTADERAMDRIDGLPLGGSDLSVGAMFVRSDEFKAFRPGSNLASNVISFPDVDVKTLITTSAGFAPDVMRTGRIIPSAQLRFDMLDLVTTIPTVQAGVHYMEETTFTNNAAEKAQGAAAGEAALVWTERMQPIQTVATFVPVSEEQLQDEAQIESIINQRLGYMVRRRVASQGINGDGVAPNLLGILNKSGIQTQARGTDPIYDAIWKAIDLVEEYDDMSVTGIIMNNRDYRDVVLTTTTHGQYIFGNPADTPALRVFGVPVIKTQSLAENTAVVGDFNWAGFYTKQGLDIQIGWNGDDFKNHVRSIKAVIRCAWVWERPKAFCTITSI